MGVLTPIMARAALTMLHARKYLALRCAIAFALSDDTRGTSRTPWKRVRKHCLAACVLRRFWTRMSRMWSSCSTARHRSWRSPLIGKDTASRCHVSPGCGRRRRSRLASSCPHFRHHCADGFVGDGDAACEHECLHVAGAQGEARGELNTMTDDFTREAVTRVALGVGWRGHAWRPILVFDGS